MIRVVDGQIHFLCHFQSLNLHKNHKKMLFHVMKCVLVLSNSFVIIICMYVYVSHCLAVKR